MDVASTSRAFADVLSMECAMVCPCAGPRISVRKMSRSRVPWRMSPASGGLFLAIRVLHSNDYGRRLYSTRMSMGSSFTPQVTIDPLSAREFGRLGWMITVRRSSRRARTDDQYRETPMWNGGVL